MGFTGVLLCAAEYQPRSRQFPGLHWVGHCPLVDHVPTPEEMDTAMVAASALVEAWESGETVLVTCAAGRNRSAMVCAMALNLITCEPASKCIGFVKQMREPDVGAPVLFNQAFVELIRATAVSC
jgi:protein-tyrosine phosphatase